MNHDSVEVKTKSPPDKAARGFSAGGDPLDYQRFTVQDAKSPPHVSPMSLGTTPVQIIVPSGAVVMVAKGDGIFWFGDNATLDGSGTGKGYKVAAADKDTFIPVTDQSTLYVKAASGTIAFDFMFAF